jgi:ligand-binding sensor domain-containing protein/signal transduction histidine kinase/DNA-binding response OmpR family regulator
MLCKKKYVVIAFLQFFMILSNASLAQRPKLKFKHITNEQGLSNTTIEAIFQDNRGFMWFGTRDGLNRYDGYQIVVYRFDAKDSNSISDNYILYIYEDRQQNLWVGTTNGLNRFNAGKNNFTRYKHISSNPKSISNHHITSIFQDKKERLWISTLGGGINLFNPKDETFTSYQQNTALPNSLNSNNVNYIYEDSRRNCWVGTETGLQLFNRELGTFETINILTGLKNGSQNYSIRLIKEDKPGSLLLGTNDNGIILFNYQLKTFKQYSHKETEPLSLANNLVRSILIDKNGSIWIGSVNGGLNLFDPVSESFFNYQNQPDDPLSLSQRTVSALFEDNQGNLWAGTHRGGINLYMPNTEKFTLFRQQPDVNSLSYNDVKGFCEDHYGNIWIGTDGGGLNLFNPKQNSFKHYKYSPFDSKTIGSNEVLDITEDSEGNLWVSTWGGGLCLYNKPTNSFIRFMHNPADINSVSSNYIQKVFEDSKKNLWVATYFNGLNLFDRKSKKFTRVINGQNNTHIQGNNIISINEDKTGNIWIGTDDGGLNCLTSGTKEFTHYLNNDEKKPDLRIIFIDSKGRIWIGQTGLYLFDAKKKSFSTYTDKGGLASEFIKGIAEDQQGNFWISTSNGITRFNPETFVFKKYNTADGLQGLEFEANAFLKTKAGQFFFGGVNGFNMFYPQDITANTFVPPVYVTGFQVFNKKIDVGEKDSPLEFDISFTDKINLSYKQSTFSFEFASLNYTVSENNQYAYKLEEWDKDWINAGNAKKASYTNVSPGHYVFRVKASNNDGVWNENGYAINITITPPFWATLWFRLLVLIAFGTAVVLFYRFKRKLEIQKLEEQKKEEIHQVQLQFFTNISHEFRTPLSLILGPIEKLQKEDPHSPSNHYYKVIHKNANRLMNLITELMDFRKAELGVLKLNVMPGNLDSFLQEISEEFGELALEKKIDFTVKVKDIHAETWFDRQVLEKIVLNLLSNSFKYTADRGTITVEAFNSFDKFTPTFQNKLAFQNEYKANQFMYIRVADNGIGISKESIEHLFERYYKISETHLGSGIGLAFVKSLTTLHKGHIYVFSEKNKGTEIIIGIPCAKDDYSIKERWIKNKEAVAKLESIASKYADVSLLSAERKTPVINDLTVIGKPNILVVDDNDELRQFIKESLSNDYTILEAINGKTGYEKAKTVFPDLIISDVMMPEIDGNEFCKMIKEDIDTSHIPFLMLTAKDALESKIAGIESGADFYFSKPLSIELLELTIRNILKQKQKLKEKYLSDHHAEIKDLAHSSKDKDFLDDLIKIIEIELSNPEMNIAFVCTQIGMSRTKLYNKIKGLTGQSINDFIRTIRLKKAAQLMTEADTSITEVMYSVGIQTQSYFTKAFKNEFGKTPTQFLKDLKK